jgi:hypothetical protein
MDNLAQGPGIPISPEDPTSSMVPPDMSGDQTSSISPNMSGAMPEQAPTDQVIPDSGETSEDSAPSGGKTDGLKRELLQKMMGNLLNKPGRSVNELVNGVKAVIGAYKNYSKEWDSLNGVTESTLPPAGAPSGGGSSDIQAILDKIKATKGDGTQATMPSETLPTAPPAITTTPPTGGAGGPGYSKTGYNQPPPVSNLGIWGY